MSDKKFDHYLWWAKYSPQTISDMILPKTMKAYFTKMVNDKEIPNLLFYSNSPGTGKSCTARALIHDLDCDSKEINSSLENGIDIIREDVERFISCASFSGSKKIVLLDKFDGISTQSQKALRGLTDKFSDLCSFIVTCNYMNMIIEPIQSRFQIVDFNFTEPKIKEEMFPKIVKFLELVLKAEKIEVISGIIEKLVQKHYPDIRKMLNICQHYTKEHNILDNGILSFIEISDELVTLILDHKFTKSRDFIINNNYNYTELYSFLYRKLVPKLLKEKQPEITMMIARYAHWNENAIDKELNCAALLYEIIATI